jgi:membrane protein required for beta-lactamase induction
MDVAGELAKCRAAADRIFGVSEPADVKRERVVAALLEARADVLREFTAGWDDMEPDLVDELTRESQALARRGL